ncbi:MAG: (Fe-S)-binding protein [Gammaproteobacteria bacterium]|nr:(Fe-S)-binding protein [Gammaproteobacteria bacterium]
MALSSDNAQRNYPPKPKQVYLFATCLVDMFAPHSGLDAIKLLERQGLEVLFPQEQSCCGQPAYNSGYEEDAKKVAEAQIKLFPLEIPIVVLSGSCAGMMRHHYLKLFKDRPEMQHFCDRIFELTEFLVNVARVQLTDKGTKESVALHTSCAARREMGVHKTSRELLGQLDNVTLVTHDYESECCGFGGTFSIKHPDISAAMVTDKCNHLEITQTSRYISADWGCMLNINGALEYQHKSFKGEHIASYLLERTITETRSYD